MISLFTNGYDVSEVLIICLKGCLKTVVILCRQHTHHLWLAYTHIMTIAWSAPAKTHFICSRTIVNLKSDY